MNNLNIANSKLLNNNKFKIIESSSFYLMLFFAGIVILFLRSTYAFSSEVIYTEDGTWLGQIYQNGFWHTMFHAKASYLVVGNILLLKFADILNWVLYGDNLSYLPMFIAFTHYLFYSACAIMPVIIFKKQLFLSARLFLWGMIILLPTGYHDGISFEIFGKISNTGYMFFLIAFCFLTWRKNNKSVASVGKFILCDIIIILSCATNPVCFVEVAIFFIVDFVEVIRNSQIKFDKAFFKTLLSQKYILMWFIMGCILCIMAIFIIENIGNESSLTTPVIPTLSNTVSFLSINWLYPFTFLFYKKLTVKSSIILLCLCIILFLTVIIIDYKIYKKGFFFPIAIAVAMIIFTASSYFARPGLLEYFDNFGTFPHRYAYVQGIFATILFSYCLSSALEWFSEKKDNHLFCYLVSFIILLLSTAVIIEYSLGLPQILEFNRNGFTNYNFKETINTVYDTEDISNGVVIPIEFSGWEMYLPKDKIIATYYGIRNVKPVSNVVRPSKLTDDNWKNGVLKTSPIMLFDNTETNLRNLLYYNNGSIYTSEGNFVHIINVEVKDQWIWVTVDDYEKCVEIANSSTDLYLSKRI